MTVDTFFFFFYYYYLSSSVLPLLPSMARTLFNTASLLARSFNMKGFASASPAAATVVKGSRSLEEERVEEKKSKTVGYSNRPSSSTSSSWVPDPITGYYRPGNQKTGADAAELRKILLSDKS